MSSPALEEHASGSQPAPDASLNQDPESTWLADSKNQFWKWTRKVGKTKLQLLSLFVWILKAHLLALMLTPWHTLASSYLHSVRQTFSFTLIEHGWQRWSCQPRQRCPVSRRTGINKYSCCQPVRVHKPGEVYNHARVDRTHHQFPQVYSALIAGSNRSSLTILCGMQTAKDRWLSTPLH
jgi:hypothetical protein